MYTYSVFHAFANEQFLLSEVYEIIKRDFGFFKFDIQAIDLSSANQSWYGFHYIFPHFKDFYYPEFEFSIWRRTLNDCFNILGNNGVAFVGKCSYPNEDDEVFDTFFYTNPKGVSFSFGRLGLDWAVDFDENVAKELNTVANAFLPDVYFRSKEKRKKTDDSDGFLDIDKPEPRRHKKTWKDNEMPFEIKIASKLKKPILRLLEATLPQGEWQWYSGELCGKPLWHLFTTLFARELKINEFVCDDEDEKKDVVYYLNITPNLLSFFEKYSDLMLFLKDHLGEEGSAIVLKNPNELSYFYNGADIIKWDRCCDEIFQKKGEKALFNSGNWLSWTRDHFCDIKNTEDEKVDLEYQNIMNQLMDIMCDDYRKGSLDFVARNSSKITAVEIKGKSFCMEDHPEKYISMYLKRLIEEKGGFVEIKKAMDSATHKIEGQYYIDAPYDYCVSITKHEIDIIPLGNIKVISDKQLWKSFSEQKTLDPEDAKIGKEEAMEILKSKKANFVDHVPEMIKTKEKEYLEMVKNWVESGKEIREILDYTQLTEAQKNKIDYNCEIVFSEHNFSCAPPYGMADASIAKELIEKEIKERGGKTPYKSKYEFYTILTYPYHHSIVNKSLEDAHGPVITDVQFWRAIYRNRSL